MADKQLTLPGELVKKSNEFVRSRVTLDNSTAGKIFTSIIACIRPEDKDFKDYQIPASVLFTPGEHSGYSYASVRKALKIITGYVVEMELNGSQGFDSDGYPPYAMYPLFAKAVYYNGIITAQIHPDLKPHFIGLAKNFTIYGLINYLSLSSIYSQRLFEILSSYAKTCADMKISLEKLHFMLDTPESFKKRFPDFRRFVLEQAHKEINHKTDLEYEWLPIKQGRMVIGIQFIFSKKILQLREQEKRQKNAKQQIKYAKPASECAKITQPNFIYGKCPKEKKKTLQCKTCKLMDYFLKIDKQAEKI